MTNRVIDHTAPIGPATRPNSARIIAAIAAKDLSQIVKNRALLSMVISTLFIVVLYRVLPLISNEAEPAVLLYDPAGESALTAALDGSDEVRTYVYDSAATVTRLLQHGDVPEMGLVLPDDIEAELAADGPLNLTGQVAYWVSDREAAGMAGRVADVLSAEIGRPVTIAVSENRVFSTLNSTGLPFVMAISLILAVLMVGLGMVPLLMLEEKNTHTLDALLVSPATPAHVTLGKATAGLVLALIASGISVLIYRPVIVQWGLTLAAILGWSLWVIAAGLLVGSLVTVRQQHQIAMWVLFLPLVIPAFLLVMTDLLPAWLPPYLQLVPSAAGMDLLRMTGMTAVPLNEVAWRLALVYGTAFVMMMVVVWRVRRERV